jgi:hypothetical protein
MRFGAVICIFATGDVFQKRSSLFHAGRIERAYVSAQVLESRYQPE